MFIFKFEHPVYTELLNKNFKFTKIRENKKILEGKVVENNQVYNLLNFLYSNLNTLYIPDLLNRNKIDIWKIGENKNNISR